LCGDETSSGNYHRANLSGSCGPHYAAAIKSALLQKESLPNILDYPGGMSQWEKESLAAEARLGARPKGKSNRHRNAKE
jgi:hypothetical protein